MGRKSKALPERRGERSGEPQARDEGEAEACLGRGGDRAAVLPCPTQNGETSGRAVARKKRARASVGLRGVAGCPRRMGEAILQMSLRGKTFPLEVRRVQRRFSAIPPDSGTDTLLSYPIILTQLNAVRGRGEKRHSTTTKQEYQTNIMSTSSDQAISVASSPSARKSHSEGATDELTQLKLDLLRAEVRLAKSRAGVAGAEADVKVLSARLRAFTSR